MCRSFGIMCPKAAWHLSHVSKIVEDRVLRKHLNIQYSKPIGTLRPQRNANVALKLVFHELTREWCRLNLTNGAYWRSHTDQWCCFILPLGRYSFCCMAFSMHTNKVESVTNWRKIGQNNCRAQCWGAERCGLGGNGESISFFVYYKSFSMLLVWFSSRTRHRLHYSLICKHRIFSFDCCYHSGQLASYSCAFIHTVNYLLASHPDQIVLIYWFRCQKEQVF